jgi:23S rRNA (guanosine2251-2'-O)-methyltransferase
MKTKGFWIGGKHAVLEALKNSNRKIYRIVTTEENRKLIDQDILEYKKLTLNIKNKKEIDKIFQNEDIIHQNFASEIENFPNENIKDYLRKSSNQKSVIVVLDDITDQRNIGSIVRSCVAFSVDGIVLLDKNFNSTSKIMFKSASGALEHIKIFAVSNISNALQILKENNFWIYALDQNSKDKITGNIKSDKIALVFGSEESGIRRLVKENCDFQIRIPIKNIESLNVSNAVAVTLGLYRFLDN